MYDDYKVVIRVFSSSRNKKMSMAALSASGAGGEDGTGAGFRRPGRQRLGSPAGWLMANRKRNMVEEEGERRVLRGGAIAPVGRCSRVLGMSIWPDQKHKAG